MIFRFFMAIFFCLSAVSGLEASTFVLPTTGDLVGEIQYIYPEVGETLSDVGIRFDVGYFEMVRANPQADPTRQLSNRTKLVIPSQYILPPALRQGIVINLAEYRLYYFPPGDNIVITMPVGIGREGWNTPLGVTNVTVKERDPIWRPTDNVRAEAAKNGTPIPNQFPPGVGNPLGRHVLRLGWPTYLIHGTNRRDGVGSRVSAGCIRMMPEDIEQLFDKVAVGTLVTVINEPVKLGQMNGKVYLEAYPLLFEQKNSNLKVFLARQLANQSFKKGINTQAMNQELAYPRGIPRLVSS